MDPDPRQYDHITLRESDIHDIVLSYLVHNCFRETAESFIGCSRMFRSTDVTEKMMDMVRRRSILTHALEGDALKAIELTGELTPKLLEENQDLYFDLLGLHFVNLVHSRKCTEALEFAQTMLTPFGKVPRYVEKLEDFMALLAYEEPEKSPMFHLLGQEHRENVAHSLNRAILVAHSNLPGFSSMERLIRQVTVVRLYLNKESGKEAPQPFSLQAFVKN